MYIFISPLKRQLENISNKTVKTNKQYSIKSCANEQLKSVKDDLCYLAHVAQMNGEIDADYSQRPQIF